MTNQTEIFFNTVNLSGDDLKKAKSKAGTQNAEILEYFLNHHYQDFTPCQIWLLFGQKWPLTSIRRSITTLTEQGWLVKTDNKRKGIYGEMNYTWKYQPKPNPNGKI